MGEKERMVSSIVNIPVLVVGAVVTLIGFASFFYPDLSRLISIPVGTTEVKAIITSIAGILIISASFFI